MEKAVTIENLHYAYSGDNYVLNGISLEVPKGAFTVVSGPTGAGKTTLMFSLNGIVPELTEGTISGAIHVMGKDVMVSRVQDMLSSIGVVMQDPETQVFGRTVREDTEFGPRNLMLAREEIRKRVGVALAQVGLQDFELRETDQLSGGEKQRLAIAGILALKPLMMVLDEPTSELDPLGRMDIYRTIQKLRKEDNMTIIGVEHSTQDIIQYADYLVIIRDGKVCWRGDPKDLLRNIPLCEQFGIKPVPVALLGWKLYKYGLCRKEEIPLFVEDAESLVRRIMKHRRVASKVGQDANKTRPAGEPIIEIQSLTHRYPSGIEALTDITLTVHKGDFIALIGQNGAGKTTLAKHLNGLLEPTSGTVHVLGADTRETPISQLAKSVGYVFQNPDHQIFSTSVKDEIEYGMKNIGLGENEIAERTKSIVEMTSLSSVLEEHPLSLGKGQRQMVAVASILALRPEILVIDEPTTGQDWAGIQRMMELVTELHRQGTTIIMISHDMDIVAEYASRVVVLTQGAVKADDAPKKIFWMNDILREAHVTPPQIALVNQQLSNELSSIFALTPDELADQIHETEEAEYE